MNFKSITLIVILLFSSSLFACITSDIKLKSTDPSTGDDFELIIKAFIPSKSSDKQVIILPPIGGTTLLENRYAKKVCLRGVPAYVFVNWSNDMEESIEDLSVHNRGTLRGLHAVDIFLKQYPFPSRILGTSLGGLYAGIAAGKFDLIEKVSIVASGTNLSQILATSTLEGLKAIKKKRFELYNFKSEEEYAQEIKKHLTYEAFDFKNELKHKKLLFLRTNSDTVILPKFQDELINLFAKENVNIYRTRFGHTSGIVYTSVRRANLIANFLTN